MEKTKIDWADSTWNPVTGCLHGCEYCYARRIAERFGGFAPEDGNGDWNTIQYCKGCPRLAVLNGLQARKREDGKVVPAVYPFGFTPTLHRYRLDEPRRWKKPRTIFVCSMADLFGEWVPDKWIKEVFQACEAAPWHRYLFLSKNPSRYETFKKSMPDNMWFGWSQEGPLGSKAVFRESTISHVFVSIEPLLRPFDEFHIKEIDWAIVGAETGNRKNRVVPEKKWVMDIAEACNQAHVPLFMKESLRELMGSDFRQEFPWEV